MAASLRAAATRTLRPAVLPGGGLRRLLHTHQRYEPPRGYLSSQIQQKKEELYDLIALAKANSAASRVDKLLFRSLCNQVEPRPHDPQWRHIKRVDKICSWIMPTFVFVNIGATLCAIAGRAGTDGNLYTTEGVRRPVELSSLRDGVRRPVVLRREGVQKPKD
ncbi:uncharacterized protein LOC119349853 [Triticum dicoccoides]|uniref:uncharacterized protein LOC119349853 n=1 Tax=Triticum dicoccoides TaxID=85692 RepID=UPI00084334C2|nr:uncharacterized protein LOC119349853 [Triticum dicoccoides]XP_037473844.1 uncharacterized protein LOC119349853 [Triticum dicoccoides]XP_044425485.1 uncharacterized protein LOC123149809 [Triticum aestivum]XP_044425490.1 uncharacterized protein LOC123149809 [Triticum aestivum]